MAFDGIVAERRIRTATGYMIMTGAPPVSEQLADQVRSSSGMTFGTRRPGGGPAMMPSAFVSSRIAERPPAAPRFVPPEPAAEPDRQPRIPAADRLLEGLRELDAEAAALPARSELVARYGRILVHLLTGLQERGRLKFWCAHAADRAFAGAFVIRLTGSQHELRTANAPSYIHA